MRMRYDLPTQISLIKARAHGRFKRKTCPASIPSVRQNARTEKMIKTALDSEIVFCILHIHLSNFFLLLIHKLLNKNVKKKIITQIVL